MSKKFKCPVCDTPLNQLEFDKALGLWQDKQEQIKHLETQSKKHQINYTKFSNMEIV